MKLFIALLIVAGLASTQASCPNSCSGHGTCIADPKDSCQCYTRLETNHEYGKAVTVAAWTGADCSLRTCPSGYAWAAAPQDDQDHKQKLECSGKGQCDRKSGECKYQHWQDIVYKLNTIITSSNKSYAILLHINR